MFCLCPYLEKNADYADARAARRCFAFGETCCRSRFGAADRNPCRCLKWMASQKQLQSGCDSRFRRRRNSDELRER